MSTAVVAAGSSPIQLQPVTVEGDTLDVSQEHRLVSLRRACEVFGLGVAGQLKKLRDKPWARVEEKYTRDSAGRIQKAILIDANTLHGWLLNTDSRKIKPEHRAKLEAYQNNALNVLTAFFSGQPIQPALPARPWDDRLIASLTQHVAYIRKEHPGDWSVISAVAPDLLSIEIALHEHRLPTGPDDLPDGSIGSRWQNECQRQKHPRPIGKAPLLLPGRQVMVPVSVYPNEMLPAFHVWFRDEYLPTGLPDYFANKPQFKPAGKLVVASAADRACRSLTGAPAELKPRVRAQLDAAGGIVRVGDPCAIAAPKRKALPAVKTPSLFDTEPAA